MGAPATLRVDIVADAKGVGSGVDTAGSKFSKLGRIGTAALAGVGVAIGAAVVGLGKLAAGAAEDEKSAAALARTLKNTTGATRDQVAAVEDWITKQGKQLGVADDELRPAMQKLAAATGDVGKAQELASLAMDISAGTGKDLSTVTEALAKAQNGSLGGLSRLGARTKNAAGETKSFAAITKDLARIHKGQASTAANTAAGKFDRLKLRLTEMGEGIGKKVLPIGNKLIGWALKMAPKAERLAQDVAKKLGPAFRAVGDFIKNRAIPAAQDIYRWFVDKIAPGIRKTLTPVLEGGKTAFNKVRDAIERNRPQLEKLLTVVKRVAEWVADKLAPVLGKTLGTALEIMGDNLSNVIDIISNMVDWIDTAIGKVKDLIGWIKDIDIPKIDIPGIGGSNAGVYALRPALVGDSPSYDQRRGWSTASLGDGLAGLAGYLRRGAAAAPASGRSIVYAPQITVQGAVDPVSTARQIRQLLADDARRFGLTS